MKLMDVSLLDWSRAQFAMTAMYHWLFVPLTLGLGVIMSIMETIYVRTGNEEWKRITKFWMTLFGINFAIGVATGIILEFEFGTNWSNYSWFVGDIFGAPLAIEGILAFFMESTFISIMFFGWNKVSKSFHLASTWLTVTGATLSALWILVANAWMQHPVGMQFNPITVRNEMVDFWAVISPFAIHKFLHTVFSGWVMGSLFVVGISSWYLLKKREINFAKNSILIASIFGLSASLLVSLTGDSSAYDVAQHQPMKLAAMEGIYKGEKGTGLIAFGILNPEKKMYNDSIDPFLVKVEIPKMLSILGYRDKDAFVPGINDILKGGYETNNGKAMSFEDKQERGLAAIESLKEFQNSNTKHDEATAMIEKTKLKKNFSEFGYGYLKHPSELVPDIPMIFYSFHLMVALGLFFIALFGVVFFMTYKNTIESTRWIQWICLFSIPLGYVAGELGWIVAEMGRQPWAIQDVLPLKAAISGISSDSVKITFFLFLILFTALLIAEIRIMLQQIKKGPEME
jgi:cytochrome d ubiquinol oxidase subunit I